MNLYFLFLSVVFPNILVYAQTDILNKELIYPERKILYRGLYQELEVVGLEIDSTFNIVTNNGDTLAFSGNSFIAMGGQDSILTIQLIKNGNLYHTTTFKLEKLNDPKIYLGKIRDTLVTKEELVKNLQLYLSYEPQLAKACFSIMDFEVFIITKNGKWKKLDPKKEQRKSRKLNLISDEDLDAYYEKMNKKYRKKNYLTNQKGDSIYNFVRYFYPSQLQKIQKMKKDEVLLIGMCKVSCPSCVQRKKFAGLRFRIK